MAAGLAGARRGRFARPDRGAAAFTLIEVAAATAVLVVSILAGTGLTLLAGRHVAAVEGRVADRDAALELLWSLEPLPYAAAAGTPSLVSQLFPHAVTVRNSADAFYVAAASARLPAGSFATRRRVAGRTLLTVARFLERDLEGAWCATGDESLSGRDLTVGQSPPALLVEVCSEGRAAGLLASRIFAADPPAGDLAAGVER